MARRMRSGTFVGPGTKRKLRPAIRDIAVSFDNGGEKQSENPRLSLKLHQHGYSAPPAPQPQPHGRVGETVLSEGKSQQELGEEAGEEPGKGEKTSPLPGVTPVAPRAHDARLPEVSE